MFLIHSSVLDELNHSSFCALVVMKFMHQIILEFSRYFFQLEVCHFKHINGLKRPWLASNVPIMNKRLIFVDEMVM